MKIRHLISALTISSILLTGCANSTVIEGTRFVPYGLLDSDQRNPKVFYKISVGTIILSVVTLETVIIPIIAIGFYLYEPVCKLPDNAEPGVTCSN